MRMSQKVNHDLRMPQDKEASRDYSCSDGEDHRHSGRRCSIAIGGNDTSCIELTAQMKGEYEALQEEAIQKNCDVAKEMKAAEKIAEKQKQEQPKQHNQERMNR